MKILKISLFAIFLTLPLSLHAEQVTIDEVSGDQRSSDLNVESGGPGSAVPQGDEWRVKVMGKSSDSGADIQGDENTIVTRQNHQLVIRIRSGSRKFQFSIFSRGSNGRSYLNRYEANIVESAPSSPTLFVKAGISSMTYRQTGIDTLSASALSLDLEYRSRLFSGPFQFSLRGSDTFFASLQNIHFAGLGTIRLINTSDFSFGVGPSFSVDYTTSSNATIGYDPTTYPGVNADMVIAFARNDQLITRLNYGFLFKNSQFAFSHRDLRLEVMYQHLRCFGYHSCLLGLEFSGFQYTVQSAPVDQTLTFSNSQFKLGFGF